MARNKTDKKKYAGRTKEGESARVHKSVRMTPEGHLFVQLNKVRLEEVAKHDEDVKQARMDMMKKNLLKE